jgi:hypothetical protein
MKLLHTRQFVIREMSMSYHKEANKRNKNRDKLQWQKDRLSAGLTVLCFPFIGCACSGAWHREGW